MLIFDGNSFTIDGVTVFADHEEDNRAWYLPPTRVELAKRGDTDQPNFSLLTYRPVATADPNVTGGGFLMLESVLPLHDATRDRIIARLQTMGMSQPQLSPVPLDNGRVRIVGLDIEGTGGTTNPGTGLKFVEKVMGATKPAMTGDQNALFNLVLSEEGATAVKKVFEAGAANFGVIYEYDYMGLTPDLSVIIEANFKRIYDHLSFGIDVDAGATINGMKFKLEADIDLAFEELTQNGAIKVKVIDFTGADDRNTKEEWALRFFKDELMKDWFEPTLAVPRPAGAGGSSGSPVDNLVNAGAEALQNAVTGGGSSANDNDNDSSTPAGNDTPAAGNDTPAAGGGGTAVPHTGGGGDDTQTDGDDTQPAGDDTQAGGDGNDTTGGGDQGGDTEADGDDDTDDQDSTTETDDDEDSGGGGLEALNVTVGFKMKKVEQIEDKTVTLRYDRQKAVQRSHVPQGPLNTLAGELSGPPYFVDVDLDSDFFRTLDITIHNMIDYQAIGLMKTDVELEYGRTSNPSEVRRKDFPFTGPSDEPAQHQFFLNDRLDLTFRVKTQYHFDPASEWEGAKLSYEIPVEETVDRTLQVNPAKHLGFIDFTIQPGQLDEALLRHSEVRLTYEGGGWSTSKTFFVTPGGPVQHWKLRTEDQEAKTFGYQIIHHLADGTTQAGDSGETDASTLLVDDPFDDSIDIEFVPDFDAASIRQVFVHVSYEDRANNYERDARLTFTSEMPDAQVLRWARFSDGPEEVTIRATSMGVDNAVTRHAPVTVSNGFVFLSELMV